MSNGKPCEAHSIPVDICARCRGASEERERIIEILRNLHEKNNCDPMLEFCSACVTYELFFGSVTA
jgi:hypothetical protein